MNPPTTTIWLAPPWLHTRKHDLSAEAARALNRVVRVCEWFVVGLTVWAAMQAQFPFSLKDRHLDPTLTIEQRLVLLVMEPVGCVILTIWFNGFVVSVILALVILEELLDSCIADKWRVVTYDPGLPVSTLPADKCEWDVSFVRASGTVLVDLSAIAIASLWIYAKGDVYCAVPGIAAVCAVRACVSPFGIRIPLPYPSVRPAPPPLPSSSKKINKSS